MNHSFTPSQINVEKCARCHFSAIDHTNRATCEACGNTGTCEIMYGNMLLCLDCQEKEKIAQAENMKPENQAKRIMEHAQAIDNQIQIKQDFYNAETVSHIEVFKAIDADESITNKVYAKAEFLKTRHTHFAQIIFDARKTLEEATSAQRAINNTLNTIANKLRQDERDKLKINDSSYVVEKPKTVKTQSKKPSEKKYTKTDIRVAAAEHKVPAEMVAIMCVSRNMMPQDAALMLSKQLNGDK